MKICLKKQSLWPYPPWIRERSEREKIKREAQKKLLPRIMNLHEPTVGQGSLGSERGTDIWARIKKAFLATQGLYSALKYQITWLSCSRETISSTCKSDGFVMTHFRITEWRLFLQTSYLKAEWSWMCPVYQNWRALTWPAGRRHRVRGSLRRNWRPTTKGVCPDRWGRELDLTAPLRLSGRSPSSRRERLFNRDTRW